MNWPDYIIEITKQDARVPNPERMSITQLGDCPLTRTLWLKHWDKIKQEPEDTLWMVYGNALDTIVKKHCRTGMTDLKFELQMDDFIVVGKPDIYYPVGVPYACERKWDESGNLTPTKWAISDGLLVDLKTTSVWNLKEPRKEWIFQLNCYAYLMKRLMPDLEVTKLQVHGLGRDWRKNEKLRYGNTYPDSAFVIIDIPLWSCEETEKVIDANLKDHKFNPERECTPEEKWAKPDTFAVMKKGRKSALRVLDTEEEAKTWQATKGGDSIVKRPGEFVKCNSYCKVKEFCPYVK